MAISTVPALLVLSCMALAGAFYTPLEVRHLVYDLHSKLEGVPLIEMGLVDYKFNSSDAQLQMFDKLVSYNDAVNEAFRQAVYSKLERIPKVLLIHFVNQVQEVVSYFSDVVAGTEPFGGDYRKG